MKRTNRKPASASQQIATYIVQLVNNAPVALPIVIMEDVPVHTAENGYSCNDLTCPCQSALDEFAEFQRDYPVSPAYFNSEDNESYPFGPARNHEDWQDYL